MCDVLIVSWENVVNESWIWIIAYLCNQTFPLHLEQQRCVTTPSIIKTFLFALREKIFHLKLLDAIMSPKVSQAKDSISKWVRVSLPEEQNQEDVVEAAEQNGDKGAVLVKHSFVAQLDQVGVVGPARDGQDENDRQTLGRANTGVTKSAHGSRTHDAECCFGLIRAPVDTELFFW